MDGNLYISRDYSPSFSLQLELGIVLGSRNKQVAVHIQLSTHLCFQVHIQIRYRCHSKHEKCRRCLPDIKTTVGQRRVLAGVWTFSMGSSIKLLYLFVIEDATTTAAPRAEMETTGAIETGMECYFKK